MIESNSSFGASKPLNIVCCHARVHSQGISPTDEQCELWKGRSRERAITASDADQRFSEMLREAQDGETFVVTSRGPVANPFAAAIDERLTRLTA